MNPFLGCLKIIDIIGILRKIAKLCVDGICGKTLTVILGDKSTSLKGSTVQSENLSTDIRREIMALQIRRKIIQMKYIRFLCLSKSTADTVCFSLMGKIHFTAIGSPLPGSVNYPFLIKKP
mgnify:CR=1 FL=1